MSNWKVNKFEGIIGATVQDSTPNWPQPAGSPEGSPNVVVILLDDLGFSHLGSYGSDIATPNIDKLAQGGLRYNNFHTTAICSPTRAALLTGRNPHATGVSFVSGFDNGFPNTRGKISKDNALLSEILVENGYNTFAVGKWHLVPAVEHTAAGPFDNWPLGRGFERYYGFLEGATNQWNPDLVEDNRPVKQPKSVAEGYHLTEDLTDKAIEYIRDQKSAAPDKPFFAYVAYGATHAPHHAPKAYIDRYKGKYDKGWDVTRQEWFERQKAIGIIPQDAVLPPRNPNVKEWDSLSEDEKRLFARQQEAFAGFLEHTDEHIGRLVDYIEEIGQLHNTVVVLLSDNGACAMGGQEGTVHTWAEGFGIKETFEQKLARIDEIGSDFANNHYPAGWAQAGNTPLKWYKSFVHAGGVKDPLIIHYPKGIQDGGAVRTQFSYVTDIVPTVLELIGIEAPEVYKGVTQQPIHGTSLAYTFASGDEPTRKPAQYFEMVGNRGIWHKGWKAVAAHKPDTSFNDDVWELYNVDEDFTESNDLAATHPEKLRELVDLWWAEAGRNGVLPLDGRSILAKVRSIEAAKRASAGAAAPQVTERVFYPSSFPLPFAKSPDVRNKPFEIRAEVFRHSVEEEGVLVVQGGRFGGYGLFIEANKLIFHYNHSWGVQYTVVSEQELPAGELSLAFRFAKTSEAEGVGTLYVNGARVGEGPIGHVAQLGFSSDHFHVGENGSTPLSETAGAATAYQGQLKRVVFTLGGYSNDLASQLAVELATE
ncbi:arylsulfatase [Paenibacillus phyllosphaerae]|uniref:Arylsulfatase n=1 Tax=Paenibacillus phyllosphaerae TaxID=274593 RepID=A0A7W5FL25_9BACL|nr:arylsulfatase [Paenibacillus phyllosphaerae]MBB3108628.1 arylsulfatase [Paenibacillus phyllosphaerae]